MSKDTGVSWADHTFNPWWGCTRVSKGCQRCYAETWAAGLPGWNGKTEDRPVLWGKTAPRRFFGDKHWAEPLDWDREAAEKGRPALVFCASMADVFEDRRDLDDERTRLFELLTQTPNLIWLLLTHRPENVARLAPFEWTSTRLGDNQPGWPPNAWIGATIESDDVARERLADLLDLWQAPVRFVSYEPALERVSFYEAMRELPREYVGLTGIEVPSFVGRLDWVIVGAESGPDRRPFDNDWARDVRDEAAQTGTAFFYKQDSDFRPGKPGPPDLAIHQWPAQAGDRSDLGATPVVIR